MTLAALAGFIALAILLILQLPVALSLVLASVTGLILALGPAAALEALAAAPVEFASGPALVAIPLFGLVAALIGRGPLAAALLTLCRPLGEVAPLVAATALASVTAPPSTGAAALARLAGGRGLGAIAGGAGAGAMLPPSLLLLAYAAVTGTPARSLFLGGLVVGLAAFLAQGVALIRHAPEPARKPLPAPAHPWSALAPLAWVAVATAGLLAGLYGVALAATLAAGGTLALSLTWGLSRLDLRSALFEAVSTTAAIFLLGTGSDLFARFLAGTGMTAALGMAELSPALAVVLIALAALVLGTLLDAFSALAILLPLAMPLVAAQGFDPVWAGLLIAKLFETALILPPFGMIAFVLRAAAGATRPPMADLSRAMRPAVLADLLVLAALLLVPLLRF